MIGNDNISKIDMDQLDMVGKSISNVITQAMTHQMQDKVTRNKATAMWIFAGSLVNPMQNLASLVGWPGANFSKKDNRDHLGMYDYINDESKTFAMLVLARCSKENLETTIVTCGPHILSIALKQTEMIHGDLTGKIDPVIIEVVNEFNAMPEKEKREFLSPVMGSLQ